MTTCIKVLSNCIFLLHCSFNNAEFNRCRINAISNGQVRGDSYNTGCLGQTGILLRWPLVIVFHPIRLLFRKRFWPYLRRCIWFSQVLASGCSLDFCSLLDHSSQQAGSSSIYMWCEVSYCVFYVASQSHAWANKTKIILTIIFSWSQTCVPRNCNLCTKRINIFWVSTPLLLASFLFVFV